MVAPRSGPASSPAVPAFLSGRGRMALGRLCPSRQSSLHKAPFDSPRPGFLGFESRWRVLFFLSWPRGAEVFTPRGGERELGFPSVPPDNPRGSQVRGGHSHFVLPGSAANVCTARDQDDTQQTENSPAPLRAAGSEPRCLIHEMGAVMVATTGSAVLCPGLSAVQGRRPELPHRASAWLSSSSRLHTRMGDSCG